MLEQLCPKVFLNIQNGEFVQFATEAYVCQEKPRLSLYKNIEGQKRIEVISERRKIYNIIK